MMKFLLLFALLSYGFEGSSENVSSPQRVAVVGSGYVGLVLGAGLAEMGHSVICLDIDEKKIESLREGVMPIYEPGLHELVVNNLRAKRLSFSTEIDAAIRSSDVIFIAVGTPTGAQGETDTSYVESVVKTIGQNANGYKVVCSKSTVPIGTGKKIATQLKDCGDFDYVSNPEFLREGSAVSDFFTPSRTVIGVESERAKKIMEALYEPLSSQPVFFTDIVSAETIKYASNSFLAVKISFINEVANLCDVTGADVRDVAIGMGLDDRIGSKFLNPGPGFGGSCFPKDTLAFLQTAKEFEVDLKMTEAAIAANKTQKLRMIKKARNLLGESLEGQNIALLGLAFKANTDDVRYSPAIEIIRALIESGASVKAYDPEAMKNMKILFPSEIEYCKTLKEAVVGADLTILLTDWDEFREMDLTVLRDQVRQPLILDARNCLDYDELNRLGFVVENVGRPNVR